MLNIYNANHHEQNPPEKSGASPIFAKVSYQQYVDPTGEFSSSELHYGLWYVQHRVALYRLAIASLILIAAGLWVFSLIQWGVYAFSGFGRDQAMYRELRQFPDYTVMHPQFEPVPLQVSGVETFSGAGSKYDFFVDVANPNRRWIAELEYHFESSVGVTPTDTTVLLPEENRPVVYLGAETAGFPNGATLIIERVRWQRINAHRIADPSAWQRERLRFSAEAFSFIPADEFEGSPSHRITFTLVNESPYSYKAADFLVGLFFQQSLVGIMPLRLEQLQSLEHRPVDLRSLAPRLSVNEIILYPLINVYDPETFLKPTP